MITKKKRLLYILLAVPTILLIPFISMQFSIGVDWSVLDFTIMGIMLFAVGVLCELVLRRVKSLKGRVLLCGVILFAFLLIWIELAVGIFV